MESKDPTILTTEVGSIVLPSLDELACKYGTDKGSTDHNYCPHYEQYLARRRHDPLTLLELGVWKGASLRMWREYFPNATITGLDRDAPTDNKLARAVDKRSGGNVAWNPRPASKIVTITGDQNDETTINLAALYGPFDVIIDDASHISSKTIASFRLLWPHLAPGGLYVVEDLQTSYDVANYGNDEAAQPGLSPCGGGQTAMQWCKRLADEVNRSLFPKECWKGFDIASVQFFPNICFIVKAR